MKLCKSNLSPFSRVKAKNGKFGILVRYKESDLICFSNTVIFLSRYNDDLTLRDLTDVDIDEENIDLQIREYRINLLLLGNSYYGYEIAEIYEISNFNNIFKVLNFNTIINGDKLSE